MGARHHALHHFFRRGRKLSPQIRNILMGFPQVTTVANELGRPDDGTDPTGFFNNEFYVGLKPYNDAAWSGADPHQAGADRGRAEKAGGFPRASFSITPNRQRMPWTRPKPD